VFGKFFLVESILDTIKEKLGSGKKIVVFMGGTPGAGKSTYLKSNFLNVKYLDVDEIALELAGLENKPLNDLDREN
jgi:S-adenosylhomocysteine hydrolase